MKARTGKLRCERCKELIPLGTSQLRFHGRLWHTDCVIRWQRERCDTPRDGPGLSDPIM